LVAAGWLPGPLVEQVSRTAVRLLDLEPASGEDPVASGPVPFTSQALGVFGPPIDPVPPAPAPAPPSEPTAAPTDGKPGGRLSLSVTTRGEHDRPGGSRKASCTVALAVAGALAAVTVGAGVLLDLFPGGGGGHDDTAAQPPASSETSTPADGGTGPAEVPKTFAGVWEGSITAAGLPAGTMKVTIEPGGRTGERVGKAEQTDILGNFICEDLLTATSADARTLVVDARRGPRSKGMCSESTKGLRLELSGGTLRYVSADARAGNPVGDLSRSGR
ncbi:serine/threonine protein kinase, partial [Streptomyces sp. NPDC096153]